jgi:peptidylprolyl isomerase
MKFAVVSVLFFLPTFQALSQEQTQIEKIRSVYFLQDQRSLGDGTILKLLGDRDSIVARRAAIALGNIQDTSEEVVGKMTDALMTGPTPVAEAIAFSLGQLGPNERVEQRIWTGLENRREPTVRAWLLESLGKVGDEKSLKRLAVEAQHSDNPILDGSLAMCVARFGLRQVKNREGARLVALLAEHPSPDVRASAAYAFWRIGDSDLITPFQETIFKLCRDSSAEIRMFAVNALARLDDNARALEVLLERLSNETDWRVRVNTLRAMAGFSPRHYEIVSGAIVDRFQDKNEHVSLTALQVLSSPGVAQMTKSSVRKRCRESLQSIIANHGGNFTWRQVAEAAVALAKIYGGDSYDAIRRLYLSADEVRFKARTIEAIGETRSTDAAKFLLSVNDSNSMLMSSWITAVRRLCNSIRSDVVLHDRAYQKIVSLLNVGDLALTSTAASALADSIFLRESSVDPLCEAYSRLKSPDDIEAIIDILKTLGAIGGKKAIAKLEEALEASDKIIATESANALKKSNNIDYSYRIRKFFPVRHTDYDWEFLSNVERSQYLILSTEKGGIKIRVRSDEAAFTVLSVMRLVENGFFNKLVFHRVVPNFVIQGGDPRGDGWGGPGYSMRSEFSTLKFGRGSVGMASAGKDTEGCQFFITHCPTPHLDGRYTVFGEVVEGLDVVDSIQAGDTILSFSVIKN